MDCLNSSSFSPSLSKRAYALIDSQGSFHFDPNILVKKLSNNYIEVGVTSRALSLNLSNTPLIIWNDEWFNKLGKIVDPLLETLNFSNNRSLLNFNSMSTKKSLKSLNLDGCISLENITLRDCPSLTHLSLNDCTNLVGVQLGLCDNLRAISFKDCELSEELLEQILSNITPKFSPTSYEKGKYVFSSYLNLRGNTIPWNNRRIASKIRLMVLNNFAVLWDNNPPEEVLPINYYRHYGRPT